MVSCFLSCKDQMHWLESCIPGEYTGQCRVTLITDVAKSYCMVMTTLLVMCPKCGGRQKTQPKKIKGSIKRCVYCGHSFVIHSLEKERILAVMHC